MAARTENISRGLGFAAQRRSKAAVVETHGYVHDVALRRILGRVCPLSHFRNLLAQRGEPGVEFPFVSLDAAVPRYPGLTRLPVVVERQGRKQLGGVPEPRRLLLWLRGLGTLARRGTSAAG